GQRAAVEDPVRVAAEQRGERRVEQPAVETEVDADDRRVLQPRLRLAEQPGALARRYRDHEGVGLELVEALDPGIPEHRRAGLLERAAGSVARPLGQRPGPGG